MRIKKTFFVLIFSVWLVPSFYAQSADSAEDGQFEKQVKTDGVVYASGRIADVLDEQINGRRDKSSKGFIE